MAHVLQMAGEDSSQEENEGMYHDSAESSHVNRIAAAGVGMVGLVAIVAVFTFHGPINPVAHASPAIAPLTVRALLESDELTDLATDNLMALGGDALTSAGRNHVHGRVARSLQNVSDTIRARFPEAYRQLDLLQLNDDQKKASLRVLQKFGDPRMVGLAHDVAEATRQAKEENGDRDTLKRRLSEALAPRVRDLTQLSEEMFPGQPVSLDAAAALPQLRKWHPSVEVDVSGRRRLLEAADDSIEQGAQAHAHTLFKSLQGELGEKMPEAPARMLSSSSGEDTSFISCVMKAMPDPTKFCKCVADNMSEVMSMMKDFMKGKMR